MSISGFRFMAMNSPCEILVDDSDQRMADCLGKIAQEEAERIEATYSRYRPTSVLSRLNASQGVPMNIDDEMLALLEYARHCFQLSNGLFDITSGVLRKAWTFNGSDNIPSQESVTTCLSTIGFDRIKINHQQRKVILPAGVEIDFGGIAKEFAVDRALMLLTNATDKPVLVNFGGDLAVSGPRSDGSPWMVAIDAVNQTSSYGSLAIEYGAITTSGDAARYLEKDGVRYSHILNPKTGWPVEHAPRSVTVAAPNCMTAGLMSTLAMLQGSNAEQFIKDEQLQAWIIR
jgi:FAD:protein FMN transferase